ncbi:SDR family oxidoreductase [Dietzia sp. ANT_WB102]|uniref:SDR family NAD(P)-dependent oxidoreductase n=1 Tax=Dietzia sp. ANT_WB102 TaxID=2597345 RepID=UPI0011ECC636|nr:SDR family oxidoreductase [Dietzia sp. ANT_WB102]KAA0919276.1 SDR family oxidoreductase [Dietzia sp. ANT_WB102]
MTTTKPAALVTGAGRGLGRGIAELLADRGYLVMVTDLDADTAAAAATEIGRGALWAVVDVREHAQVESARDELIAAAGSLDVWVNNAGVLHTGPAWEQPEDLRKLQLNVNALGTINGTVAAIDAMRGRGGHIINIASLAGLSAVSGEAVYAASKHAVLGFSSSTAADLRLAGVKNIAISCVCPDGIWTPMLYDKLEDPQAALSFSGVLLQPEDVVRAVGKVLDSPKAVTALPAWRGMIARLGAAFPRLGVAALPLLAAQGRRVQKKLHQSQELSRG